MYLSRRDAFMYHEELLPSMYHPYYYYLLAQCHYNNLAEQGPLSNWGEGGRLAVDCWNPFHFKDCCL